MREALAKAIYAASFKHCCNGEVPEANDESWQSYLVEADAALAVMKPNLAAAVKFVLRDFEIDAINDEGAVEVAEAILQFLAGEHK